MRGYVRIVSVSDVAYAANTRWVEQIKVALGNQVTTFSDEATNAAQFGSVSITIPDNSFTYSSTTNAVTINWPAMTLWRTTSPVSTIAIAAGSLTISGLTAATSYSVYPFLRDTGGSSGTISFVGGGAGSAGYAHAQNGSPVAAAAMCNQQNIPMSQFLIATVASGTGGGGGGGRDGDRWVGFR